jgi:hypothetical protein
MEKHGWPLYKQDPRDTDPNRNAHFKAEFGKGWKKAANGKPMGSGRLEEVLTWHNLGYRLGEILGPTETKLIEGMYDLCVEQKQRLPKK